MSRRGRPRSTGCAATTSTTSTSCGSPPNWSWTTSSSRKTCGTNWSAGSPPRAAGTGRPPGAATGSALPDPPPSVRQARPPQARPAREPSLPFLYYLLMTRVLLAEDDTSISEPLSRALRREGYEVDVTADGLTTLDRALGEGVDLILLDIGLPELDGLEV